MAHEERRRVHDFRQALIAVALSSSFAAQERRAVEPGPQTRFITGFGDVRIQSAVLSLDASTVVAVGYRALPATPDGRSESQGVAFTCARAHDWRPEPLELGSAHRSCDSIDASTDGNRVVINSEEWIDRSLAIRESIDVDGLTVAQNQGLRGRRLDGSATHLVVVDLGSTRAPQRRASIVLLTRDAPDTWSRRIIASAEQYPQCGEPAIDESGGLVVFTAKLGPKTATAGTDRGVYLWRASDGSVVAMTPALRDGPVREWRVPVLSPSGTHMAASLQPVVGKPGIGFDTEAATVWVGAVPTQHEASVALGERPGFHGICMDVADDATFAAFAPRDGAHEAGAFPVRRSAAATADWLPPPHGVDPDCVLLNRERATISRDGRSMLVTITTWPADDSSSSSRKVVLFE